MNFFFILIVFLIGGIITLLDVLGLLPFGLAGILFSLLIVSSVIWIMMRIGKWKCKESEPLKECVRRRLLQITLISLGLVLLEFFTAMFTVMGATTGSSLMGQLILLLHILVPAIAWVFLVKAWLVYHRDGESLEKTEDYGNKVLYIQLGGFLLYVFLMLLYF